MKNKLKNLNKIYKNTQCELNQKKICFQKLKKKTQLFLKYEAWVIYVDKKLCLYIKSIKQERNPIYKIINGNAFLFD